VSDIARYYALLSVSLLSLIVKAQVHSVTHGKLRKPQSGVPSIPLVCNSTSPCRNIASHVPVFLKGARKFFLTELRTILGGGSCPRPPWLCARRASHGSDAYICLP